MEYNKYPLLYENPVLHLVPAFNKMNLKIKQSELVFSN